MRKTLYLMVLMFICTLPMFAQISNKGEYLVKGQVVDSLTNETVPYATLKITLIDDPDNTVKLLACDLDGKFETDVKDSGEYVLHIQSVGKAPAQKSFSLSESKKTVNLGKIYISEDEKRLEEVTVVAQKPLVKVEIDRLTYSMEDDPEAQTNSTLDMLRKVPLITVDGDDKVQLKGSSNYKIYLNGKPSNMLSGENASDVLKSMPASSIKNIEVITEPGAKYDAEGIGGIINIVTHKNTLQGYTGTVRIGGSALGGYEAGGNITTKIGKWGLSGNYNLYGYRNPWNNSGSYTETKDEIPDIRESEGRNKYRGLRNFGNVEISYELDSLNLFTIGVSGWTGNNKNKSFSDVQSYFKGEDIYEAFHQYSESRYSYGSIEGSFDFQHSTSKKDELLTFSYRLSHRPNSSKSFSEIIDVYEYPGYKRNNINDAHSNEHTFQLDYTTPLPNNQTIEGGVKYILRQNKSEIDQRIRPDSTGVWGPDPEFSLINNFSHIQHIYAAYLGYSLKYKKIGFKTGVRAEGTSQTVKFKEVPEENFNSDFFNVVPNATLSYQISMTQTIRLGYNLRVYRPGIWQLNPYVNNIDRYNISYGNPNLETQNSHGFNFSYNMFTQKFNLSASTNYSFSNNPIEEYAFRREGETVIENTYGNSGQSHYAGVYLYGRWAPVNFFNIYMNGGLYYNKYKTAKEVQEYTGVESLDGYQKSLHMGSQFTLPKDFRINLSGGFNSGWFDLQGRGTNYYYHGVTFNKTFMDKKLTVSLNCNNPFQKTRNGGYKTNTESYFYESKNVYRMRDFRLTVSYRFGTLKDSIKKVRRGINNDDSGGDGGGQGGK